MILSVILHGVMILFLVVIYITHGIYIKAFELHAGIKGFNLKIETKEKSTPSCKD